MIMDETQYKFKKEEKGLPCEHEDFVIIEVEQLVFSIIVFLFAAAILYTFFTIS